MCLRFGSLPTLIISSAKMAKEVMRTNDLQFSGRPNLTGQKAFSYKHIDVAFTPYSNYWREMRKICVIHLFNANRLHQFRPVRENEVSRMIEKISKSASASEPANLSEIIMSLLCNLICRIAFSKRCEDDDGQAERVGNKTRFHHILAETQAMAGSFFFSDFFPFMGWVDTLTGKNRRLKKAFEDSDKFYQELVDEHLDPNRPKVDQQQEDIIDVLLRIRKNSETKIDLTWKHIKAVLMVINLVFSFSLVIKVCGCFYQHSVKFILSENHYSYNFILVHLSGRICCWHGHERSHSCLVHDQPNEESRNDEEGSRRS